MGEAVQGYSGGRCGPRMHGLHNVTGTAAYLHTFAQPEMHSQLCMVGAAVLWQDDSKFNHYYHVGLIFIRERWDCGGANIL
jgi:hypothetical protein